MKPHDCRISHPRGNKQKENQVSMVERCFERSSQPITQKLNKPAHNCVIARARDKKWQWPDDRKSRVTNCSTLPGSEIKPAEQSMETIHASVSSRVKPDPLETRKQSRIVSSTPNIEPWQIVHELASLAPIGFRLLDISGSLCGGKARDCRRDEKWSGLSRPDRARYSIR